MSEYYSDSDDDIDSTAYGQEAGGDSDSSSTEEMNSPGDYSDKKKKKKKKKAKEKDKEREKKKKKKKKKEKDKSPKKKKKHSKDLDESLSDHENKKEKKKRKKLLLKEAAEEGISVEELKKRKKKEKKRQAKLLLKSRASGKSAAAQKLKAKAAATLKKRAESVASPKAGGRARTKTDDKKKKNGYQLWCEDNRKRMQDQNPEMDFVALSKRLGEMWHTKPDREKQLWKRKARELSDGSSVGQAGRKGRPKLLKSGAGGSGKTSSMTSPRAKSPTPVNGDTSPAQPHSDKNPALYDTLNSIKPPGTSTQDAAAHLKLLGDSLFIIGQKLQAHTTPVAVSGSMSVLLDSLLCSMGPLLVTTRAIPELDGLPSTVHSDTLNSLAHIMPGL